MKYDPRTYSQLRAGDFDEDHHASLDHSADTFVYESADLDADDPQVKAILEALEDQQITQEEAIEVLDELANRLNK